MASTASTKTAGKTKPAARNGNGGKRVEYRVLMPRLNRSTSTDAAGLALFTGSVPASVKRLEAVKRHGSPLGVHCAELGAPKSLCHCHVTPFDATREYGKAPRVRVGKCGDLSGVTCRFCLTRLVAVGYVKPDSLPDTESGNYARTFGLLAVSADGKPVATATPKQARRAASKRNGAQAADGNGKPPTPKLALSKRTAAARAKREAAATATASDGNDNGSRDGSA